MRATQSVCSEQRSSGKRLSPRSFANPFPTCRRSNWRRRLQRRWRIWRTRRNTPAQSRTVVFHCEVRVVDFSFFEWSPSSRQAHHGPKFTPSRPGFALDLSIIGGPRPRAGGRAPQASRGTNAREPRGRRQTAPLLAFRSSGLLNTDYAPLLQAALEGCKPYGGAGLRH